MTAAKLLATTGLSGPTSIFDPASAEAAAILSLGVLTLAIFALIFAVVGGVLGFNLARFWKGRAARPGDVSGEPPQVYGSNPIELAWTVAPGIVVFFLILVITRTLWEVAPADPPAPVEGDGALYVTVVGRQWWWEYRYEFFDGRPLGFATANELHVPASRSGRAHPIHLRLESADVCHSFWIPRLQGKVDLIPGRTNHLTLQTNDTGLFLGQCAEYCGTQHAGMLLRVVAEEPARFEDWLRLQSAPARIDPAAEVGRQRFLQQSCVNCHRIRGAGADGDYAPDLTHLMSRRTIASGLVPNTPENLAAWVRDPHSMKPGCLMPAFGLNAADSEEIVRFLLTLE